MRNSYAWIGMGIGSGLFTLVGGIFGYMMNSYMSRDHITIEEVRIVSTRRLVNVGQVPYAQMIDCSRKIDREMSGGGFFSSHTWLDSAGNVRSGRERDFLDHIYQIKTTLAVRREYIDEVNSRVANLRRDTPNNRENIPSDILRLWQRFTFQPNTRPSLHDIEKHLEQTKERIKKCSELVKGIQDKAFGWKNEERTGNMVMFIALLNSGDTDGLVQPYGKLMVKGIRGGDIQINVLEELQEFPAYPLKRMNNSQWKAIHVERKTMVIAKFTINFRRSGQDAIEDLKGRIKNNTPISFQIELKDIRDGTIRWKSDEEIVK